MAWIRALWMGLAFGAADVQEDSPPPPPELPIACDVVVCLLDPERDPCDPSEISVDLVFMTVNDETPAVYSLSRGSLSDPLGNSLSFAVLDLEGTHLKMGTAVSSTYAAAPPDAPERLRKEFLRPLQGPILPESRKTIEELDPNAKGIPFQVHLESKDIQRLDGLPLVEVSIILTIRGERKAVQCLSISKGQGSKGQGTGKP